MADTHQTSSVAAVVLAAGASTRYGGVKQRELLPAVLAALRETSVGEVVVVEGAHALEAPGARVVHCADWSRGPGTSLRCGLEALGPEVRRAVIVLADGPGLDPRAVERVAVHDAPVAAASYDGTRSHPVGLDRSVFGDVPDEGGRALEPVLVDCSDLRPPGDVDVRP
jgi:nicotine blue oxidoreductase